MDASLSWSGTIETFLILALIGREINEIIGNSILMKAVGLYLQLHSDPFLGKLSSGLN